MKVHYGLNVERPKTPNAQRAFPEAVLGGRSMYEVPSWRLTKCQSGIMKIDETS